MGVTAPGSGAPAPTPSRRAAASPEQAQRFGESVARQLAPPLGRQPRKQGKFEMPQDAPQALPLHAPREQTPREGVAPEAKSAQPAVRERAPEAHAQPQSPVVEANVADRLALPPAGPSETQLSMSNPHWVAREVSVVPVASGGLSVEIDLNQGQHNDASEELRRRLEARGLSVASVSARG